MWSGASVAHMAPVQEDLGSILKQTQMALKSPFFQTTDLKTISLICNIVMSSWNKWYYYIIIFKILIITPYLILVSKIYYCLTLWYLDVQSFVKFCLQIVYVYFDLLEIIRNQVHCVIQLSRQSCVKICVIQLFWLGLFCNIRIVYLKQG